MERDRRLVSEPAREERVGVGAAGDGVGAEGNLLSVRRVNLQRNRAEQSLQQEHPAHPQPGLPTLPKFQPGVLDHPGGHLQTTEHLHPVLPAQGHRTQHPQLHDLCQEDARPQH